MANGDGAKRTGIWVAIIMSVGTIAAVLVVDHYRTGMNCEAVQALSIEAGEARVERGAAHVERELIKGSLDYATAGLREAANAIGVASEQIQQQAIDAATSRAEQAALANRLDQIVDRLEDWE